MSGSDLIAISVGNTRTQLGRFSPDGLEDSISWLNTDQPGLISQIVEWWREMTDAPRATIVLASVHDEAARQIDSAIRDQLGIEIYHIGSDLPVPIGRQLDPETITGVDRLLNAAAAYDTIKQACIIVDAGTAVTVDFVDGEGTFHGGAIAPGARMQLQAMHEHTAALPEVEFTHPEPEAFGRSTTQAMLQGVYHGIRGMVWKLVEQYADRYGAFPLVIATGGDAPMLFGDDELIDRIVPDLTLIGINLAARTALSTDLDAREM